MKKILSIAAVALLTLVFVSCGNGNTPEGVATKAMKCLIEKDYEGYVDLLYFKEKTAKGEEVSPEGRQQLVSLLQEKAGKKIDKQGGIKDFKVGEPVIEGDKAKVPVDVTYGDGSTNQEDIKVIKTPEGKWMLDSGK